MLLITSAGYINSEMQVELGKLPSSFVPIGNKRLYEHQIKIFRQSFGNLQISLSLPKNFKLTNADKNKLNSLNIKILEVSHELSLGSSLLEVLNTIKDKNTTIKILHGDTFLNGLPFLEDMVALSSSEDEYPWEHETVNVEKKMIWCGYFSFKSVELLEYCLRHENKDFVKAIRLYNQKKNLIFKKLENWFDMGHVNTYFRSRSEITTERDFNNIVIKDGIVKKSSNNEKKISAEIKWFRCVPNELKVKLPQLIDTGSEGSSTFYKVEYLPHLPLSELYVHGELPLKFWKKIIRLFNENLRSFINVSQKKVYTDDLIATDFKDLIIKKTHERILDFQFQSNVSFTISNQYNNKFLPSFNDIIKECQDAIFKLSPLTGIMHGDLCFSNILYDSRSDSLKFIDPRGYNSKLQNTIYGDLKYDIAKFSHSLLGLYDHIIADSYKLEKNSSNSFQFEIFTSEMVNVVKNDFYDNGEFLDIDIKGIIPLVILLFFSMLPLHKENSDRQQAFLANTLRLYTIWKVI